MNTINVAKIRKMDFPVDGYRYNVMLFTSIDGGKTFYNCGNGKYCRTLEDAEAYKAEIELK